MKTLILACIGVLCLGACSSNDSDDSTEDKKTVDEATFGTESDIALADNLWIEMEDYLMWNRLDGATGLVPGAMPHGSFIRIFENSVAENDSNGFKEGSIVVKENFGSESEDALGAITVMKRIDGYSPESGDWFFAKYLPDGNLDKNPEGRALAGAIGLGASSGCIPCHASAGGNDYIFKI